MIMNMLVFMMGLLLIFIGFVIIIFALVLGGIEGEGEKAKSGGGGVIVIGPIPIIFGSNRKMALFAAILGAILMILALILFLLFNGYMSVPNM